MIGILYESGEWSDFKLARELEKALAESDGVDVEVRLVDMTAEGCVERALECDFLVSRVFASAVFRGHARAHDNMGRLVRALDGAGIAMVNVPRAHFYEIDKRAAAAAMERGEVLVPQIFACGMPVELLGLVDAWVYPCVIKPNCGGRSTCTVVAHTADEARLFLAAMVDAGMHEESEGAAAGNGEGLGRDSGDEASSGAAGVAIGRADASVDVARMSFIVEEFLTSRGGFLTRVELVDGRVLFAVKRSVTENGLSSYHVGSTYEMYRDCPDEVMDAVLRAARLLGIRYGSFDVIETDWGPFVVDANSVSNVSEDCTDLFGIDLMREYARALAADYEAARR